MIAICVDDEALLLRALVKAVEQSPDIKETFAFEDELDAINWARNVLNHFVEAVAILLVTDCVIPILVLLLFSRLIRYLFSAALTRDLPALPAQRAWTDADPEDAASN